MGRLEEIRDRIKEIGNTIQFPEGCPCSCGGTNWCISNPPQELTDIFKEQEELTRG